MKAKNLTGKSPGGKRTNLIDVIPLNTPYVVQVFPFYGCNFKCCYCIFSIEKNKRHFISNKVSMEWDLYKKFIDDLKKFPNKIKTLRFVGIGEPLLHKRIISMINYASISDIANTIEIITNGVLLTKKRINFLLTSGLNRMVISIQGITSDKYKKICGTEINLNDFIENLTYFYENKINIHVYIKTINTTLENKNDEKIFYKIFGNICDSIAIEQTVPIHQNIKYNKTLKCNKTQFGLNVKDFKICPQSFISLQLNPDGNIVPCFSFEYPEIMGNIGEKSIVDIWNGENFSNFRYNMITKNKNFNNVCKKCNIMKYRLFPEDDLDNYENKLKEIYKCIK